MPDDGALHPVESRRVGWVYVVHVHVPAVNVDQLKFFVSTDSTYACSHRSPCQTIASVPTGSSTSPSTPWRLSSSAPRYVADGVSTRSRRADGPPAVEQASEGAVRCDEGCDGLRSGESSVHSRFCSASKSPSIRVRPIPRRSSFMPVKPDSLGRYDTEEVTALFDDQRPPVPRLDEAGPIERMAARRPSEHPELDVAQRITATRAVLHAFVVQQPSGRASPHR